LGTELAGGLEPAIPLGVDLLGAAGEEVSWGDVADRAVEPDIVVVLDEAGDQRAGVVQRGGLDGANGVCLVCARSVAGPVLPWRP